MSIEMILQVSDHSKMEGSGLLLMLGVANSCNKHGYGWCDYDELARFARVGRRQVMVLMKKAKQAGEIVALPRYGNRGQLANLFVILLGLTRAEKKARLIEAIASVKGVALKPTGRVNRPAPTGVNATTPPRVQAGSPPGVPQITPGVQPATPDPSYIRPDPSPVQDSGAALPTPPAVEADKQREKQEEPKPLTEWQQQLKAMAEPMCAMTGDDINIERIKKRAGAIAAVLIKANYSPADLPVFKQLWDKYDWRGQKKQPPTLDQIQAELPRLIGLYGRGATKPGANGSHSDKDAKEHPDMASWVNAHRKELGHANR